MYAYCRVSTDRQSLKRQIENIGKAYPDIHPTAYFCDKWTGSTQDRPAWVKLLRKVKPGDVIVFDSVSRMSRDAEAGARQYEELYEQGIDLIFLNEPGCNTSVFRKSAQESIPQTGNEIADIYIEATNRVLMILAKKQVRIAFDQAEKERLDLCKRVKDGMRAAQITAAERGELKIYGAKRGVKLTTAKSVKVKAVIRQHSKDFDGTLSDVECMKLAGCARNSYYKYKSELRAEIAGE